MKSLIWVISILVAFAAGYFSNALSLSDDATGSDAQTLTSKTLAVKQSTNTNTNANTNSNQNLEVAQSHDDLSRFTEVKSHSLYKNLTTEALVDELNSMQAFSKLPKSFAELGELLSFIGELSELQINQLIHTFSSDNDQVKSTAFSLLFSRYAEMNPDAAFYFAMTEIKEENLQAHYLSSAVSMISKQDPLAGFDYILQVSEQKGALTWQQKSLFGHGLLVTFRGLAENDLVQAVDKLKQISESQLGLSMAVLGITETFTSKQDFVDLLTLTKSLDRNEIQADIIRQWTKESPEQVGAWLTEEYSGSRYDEIQSQFVQAWARTDKQKSADWLISNSEPEKLNNNIIEFLRDWGYSAPEAAMQWFKRQPSNVFNQNNLTKFIDKIAFNHPQFAEKYLSMVESTKRRSDISFNIYSGYKYKSTSLAESFLARSPYKDEILVFLDVISKNS